MSIFSNLPTFIKNISPLSTVGQLGKNTLTMTIGLIIRATLQALTFLIVAHILGVQGFGSFAAVMALASALGSFVGFGFQILLMKNIALDEKFFLDSWGGLLAALIVSAPIMFSIYLIISFLVLPSTISSFVVTMIGVGEIIFAPLIVFTICTYRGVERISRAAYLHIVTAIPRLFASLLLFYLSDFMTANECLNMWASFYVGSQFFAAGYVISILKKDFSLPMIYKWNIFLANLRQGISFSFSVVALRLYADIDKSMLARITTLEITGIYSVAYRIVDIVSLPIVALFQSAQARFFRAGSNGVSGAISYALKIFSIPLFYAISVGILLFFASDFLPFILGEDYAGASEIIRYLSLLPLVSVIRIFLQTSLLSSGYQNIAVLIFAFGALSNIILNIWFIPSMSWKGAAIATYISEAIMVVIMLITIKLSAVNKK